jgi:integron integrase
MRKPSEKLKIPFVEIAEGRGLSRPEVLDYLKWLRYYLDFCAKYNDPPRDSDSLPLFLQKLTSKGQSVEQQKQAADSISVYYDVVEALAAKSGAGSDGGRSWDGCYQLLKEEIALRHYSPKTFKTYRNWIVQYQVWLNGKLPDVVDSGDARGFLAYLALDKNVAASTQNQAFNALLFLYRHILRREYDIGDSVPRARRTKYIPVVLSRKEVDRIIENLGMPYSLIIKLLYGCGLRMSECLNLRVGDLNFDQCIVTVHRGKGGKDRTVPLPRVLVPDLHRQLEVVEDIVVRDAAAGYDGVFMPLGAGRKLKGMAADIVWQWLFPAKMITLVPASGEYRRYHVHETNLQKALRRAVRSSGVKKRVTCHTFRHSFASHLLRANYDIRTIQQLLGHADVKTTMIYTHTVRSRTLKEIESPLDFSKEIVDTLDGFEGGVLK